MDETRLGHVEHKWLAIGHLAEAEVELLQKYYGHALIIREHRKAYEQDGDYHVPIIALIKQLTELEHHEETQVSSSAM